ncbi:hypothetical protein BLNAU_7984 [Blattamonas nauphoetae]|uniref:Uncharacterized protein n=1 Tax=Blattamonas nauphoetae TaxID=2049346 RepID=A0ABQ9Y0C4_9EUKA|nr:hypothetical protein BLNAU_7984 [Blattamonas nauphoetae]
MVHSSHGAPRRQYLRRAGVDRTSCLRESKTREQREFSLFLRQSEHTSSQHRSICGQSAGADNHRCSLPCCVLPLICDCLNSREFSQQSPLHNCWGSQHNENCDSLHSDFVRPRSRRLAGSSLCESIVSRNLNSPRKWTGHGGSGRCQANSGHSHKLHRKRSSPSLRPTPLFGISRPV